MSDFSLPSDDEGFDAIEYAWSPQAEATEHLNEWMRKQLMFNRIEDITIPESFAQVWFNWQKDLRTWYKMWCDSQAKSMDEHFDAPEKSIEQQIETSDKKQNLDVFSVESVFDTG